MILVALLFALVTSPALADTNPEKSLYEFRQGAEAAIGVLFFTTAIAIVIGTC